jgi:hypothetical protein
MVNQGASCTPFFALLHIELDARCYAGFARRELTVGEFARPLNMSLASMPPNFDRHL